jgi:3-keto-disaccharide hydrolase
MNVRAYLVLALLGCSMASAETIRFDGDTPGTLPSGWTVAMTHAGGEPRWEIARDPGAPSPPFVFAQISQDRTAGRFPLAIWGGASIRNGEVSVAFKTVSGTVDQAAGIVWRYRDPNNYYIVRANALENNIVLYKVENGVRLSIAPKGMPSRSYGVKHEIPKAQWNTLRIVFKDFQFSVFFNREQVFETEDQTFANAGKTGLWTKADSVTYFDNFSVTGN